MVECEENKLKQNFGQYERYSIRFERPSSGHGASLEFRNKEIRAGSVKSTLANAASAHAALQKKLDAPNNELNAAKNTLKDQRHETGRLEDCLDTLEQHTRRNSLEIHEIPENLYSGTKHAVIKIAEVLNITIVPSDVEFFINGNATKGHNQ